MSSHIVTPGPYRATKLWNEVTKLFRAGMPLKKHRQHFRVYVNCFSASAAVDWLHELLKNNSNFGPEVTRQQTVQLLKKFFKNHVIEDVKGRWGMEDLEDNSQLYRFPSTSPLKPIPNCSPVKRKKSISVMDREGFFKFRTSKKFDKDISENVDPEIQDSPVESASSETGCCRELTEDDIQVIWKNVTLTHLQKLLGSWCLDDVLDPAQVNPQFIVYNMTKVNKHGVVSLEDKTEDLPHWVLSAMKCLANWPKYDSNQPSYPGFERDVFKTVSDYFYSLSQPLLTFQYYELFVNILVMCGYIKAPKVQCGKRKNQEEPTYPQPTKAPHLNAANLFKSTECLLMSLLRKEVCDEVESPMKEVFSSKAETEFERHRAQQPIFRDRRASAGDRLEGGYLEAPVGRLRSRSCSMEGIVDNSVDSFTKNKLFRSSESLHFSGSDKSIPQTNSQFDHEGSAVSASSCPGETDPKFQNINSNNASFRLPSDFRRTNQRPARARPRSIGNLLDIEENTEMSASSFSIHAPVAEITMRPDCSSSIDLRAPGWPVSLHGSCMDVRTGPTISRRCQSSLDLSKPAPAWPPLVPLARRLSPEQSLLQPSLERVAVEALQLCTLLLPPASRRKLQLLLRMISRMSQNVDMPRLHDVIGTRTLLVQTFSRCVLSCEEVDDLDELLATRLLSFLMDHHQDIMQVPLYLRNAVEDHISYLKSLTTCSGSAVAMPTYSFCRQISTRVFEEQKLSVSQAALADLLENLIKDKNMSVKEKKKKLKLDTKDDILKNIKNQTTLVPIDLYCEKFLKISSFVFHRRKESQFQKEYPDIYSRRFPTTESEAQLFADKPKIKPPMLLSIKKPKTFSIRN